MGRDWLEVFNGTEVQFLERMANDDVLPYEENWIRTRDGEILDIAWNNTVIRDRDGRIVGATSIGEDITIRRRNERRMAFQLSLARAVARAERLEDVAEPMVEALGTTFDCWACVYWKAEADKLVPVAVWSDGAAVADDFTHRVMASRPGRRLRPRHLRARNGRAPLGRRSGRRPAGDCEPAGRPSARVVRVPDHHRRAGGRGRAAVLRTTCAGPTTRCWRCWRRWRTASAS